MRWDFERIVLLITVMLILGCVGFMFWQRSLADELRSGMHVSENKLAQLGVIADETFVLKDELLKDGIAQDGAYKYLDKQMRTSRIGKKFNINPPSEVSGDNYEDVAYTLTPALPDYTFTLEQIAVFLIYVENQAARMKISRVRLDRSAKREAGADDAWKPSLTITDRKPLGAQG